VTASAARDGGPAGRTEHAFPSVDGARALAATAVLVHHVAFWTGDYTEGLGGRILSRLDVGVPIFFVLSGFLLSRPLFLASARGRPAPRTAAYLWRRALRILPVYWVVVTAALFLLPANRGAGPGTWLRQLGLVQTYGSGGFAEGLSHTWSLGTEVAFYLVLPFAGAALVRLARSRPERPARILVALACASVLGLVWLVWIWTAHPFPGSAADLWLPSYTGWFAAGMTLGLLSVSDPTWRPVRLAHDLGSSPGTCWALAGALFWIATSTVAGPVGLYEPTAGQAVVKNLLYLGIGGFLVLPLVFGDQRQGPVRRLLASPPMRFLGEISYGLFLVHVVVLTGAYAAFGWVPFTGNLVLVLIGTWLVSVLLAALVYGTIERPLSRWRDLVSRRPGPLGSNDTTSAATATSASS
jgi:peptidoglycan/LPS O-acetylase OafA/YrhL